MFDDVQAIYAALLAKGHQEQFFSHLGGPRKKEKGGRETLVTCPFCQKERHFSYNRDKPVWRCLHCDQHGDWIAFLKKTKGFDFKQALMELAAAAGVNVSGYDQDRYREYAQKADILESAQDIFIRTLNEDSGKAVKEYLLNRGYSDQDLEAMRVGAYVSRPTLQKYLKNIHFSESEIKRAGLYTAGFGETHTLMIPWEDAAGRTIGVVGRSILPPDEIKAKGVPKYKYSAGLAKSEGLIGVSEIRGCETIVLAEGVLDARYLSSKGLKIASVGGKDLSLSQIKLLELLGVKEVLLALDMDPAGRDATAKAADMLSRSRIRPYVVTLPDGVKDPDEFVRSQGVKAFENALRQAERWPRWNARHICQSNDLTTDRGLDRALEQAADARVRLDDPLDRRFFLEGLKLATRLGDEELQSRLLLQEKFIEQRRAKSLVQSIATKIQKTASDGDPAHAERELERGLQQLRVSRGPQAPEPYLLVDFIKEIEKMPEGLRTGYNQLDDFISIEPSTISILAGRPGHGKTTLQLNLLLNLVKLYPDKRFYFFSYEEPRARIVLKIIMILAGEIIVPEHNQAEYAKYIRQGMSRLRSFPAIDEALSQYARLAETGRLTIIDRRLYAEDLASAIASLCRETNVGAVFIDYIQKIRLRQQIKGQRYEQIKLVSEILLDQAMSQGVPILLGAQLGRGNGQSGKSRVRLDNLRECGDIEQDAALVLGIYNPSSDNTDESGHADPSPETEIEIIALKNRPGQQGREAKLVFEKSTLRIVGQQQRGGTTGREGW